MSDLIVARFVPTPRSLACGGWHHLVARIALILRTHTTRQALPEMSDRLLADIGLSRPAAFAEAARLPWDTRPRRRWQGGGTLWSVLQRKLEQMRTRRLMRPLE